MYKQILVATDGSELGQKAVSHGLSLARDQGALVTVVTVTEPYPVYAGDAYGIVPSGDVIVDYRSAQDAAAKAILDAVEAIAQRVGIELEKLHMANAEPADAILEAAQSSGCDLIIMGSHGRRGVRRLVLGSKTWEVIARSDAPVLVVK